MARRKAKAVKKATTAPILGKNTFNASIVKTASPVLSIPKTIFATNNHADFGATELAILANCIINAVYEPTRLLGQSIWRRFPPQEEAVFDPMASLARQLATLKYYKYTGGSEMPLRVTSNLISKWLQIASNLESSFAQQHKDAWNLALKREGIETSKVSFASDAERSALRQMPRPVKGCRCKVEDHEYLHDPKW